VNANKSDGSPREVVTDVASFGEIEEEFLARISRIVWCSVATVDRRGRPRTRILHPIWEGPTGWIATGRHSFKERHLAANPYVSLSYWDPEQKQVYAECKAEWEDSAEEKRRIWDLYKSTPPPLGYDPAMIPQWSDGPGSADFGVLRLIPWRIEVSSIYDMAAGKPPLVWRGAG
jgi:Pyridoxamine 5'-phosphate oxidase